MLKQQTAVILNHLQRKGSITNVEAHAVHKVRSVSSRVAELRRAGYDIRSQYKRDAAMQRYVRYVLVEKK